MLDVLNFNFFSGKLSYVTGFKYMAEICGTLIYEYDSQKKKIHLIMFIFQEKQLLT